MTDTHLPDATASLDVAHATPAVASLFTKFFAAKSRHDVAATTGFFSRRELTYIDATLGSTYRSWQAMHDLFAQVMPGWDPSAGFYPTRIVGDERGAVVWSAITPGAFGREEIRLAAIVDLAADGITRWIEHWDGRIVAPSTLAMLSAPADSYPTDFGEPGSSAAPPAMRRVAEGLTTALASADRAAVEPWLTADVVYEDLTAHLQLVGRAPVAAFLGRAAGLLPYTRPDTRLRHVVGGTRGGGWEWAADGPVGRGLTCVELNASGSVTRITSVWNGALVTDSALLDIANEAITARAPR